MAQNHKPIANHKFRHDTNYATRKPQVIVKRPYRKEDIVICTEGVNEFVKSAEAEANNSEVGINASEIVETVETDVFVDSLSTDTDNDIGGLNEEAGFAETETGVDFSEEAEINEDLVGEDFSGFSNENTKKELIEYAEANGIAVKDWWGKQKILDAITSQ